MVWHPNPIPIAMALITMVLAFCGVILGRLIMRRSPEGIGSDTRGFVRIEAGLMTSMVALLLSLQLSSAKTAFDAQEHQVTEVAAQVIFVDTALAHSGRGSVAARATLHQLVEEMYEHTWPNAHRGTRIETPPGADLLYEQINEISPANRSQQFAKSEALDAVLGVGKTLQMLSAQNASSATVALLIVEMAWATGIFILFGLLAPSNRAAITVLALTAVTVASAIYLIAEMSAPFSGTIRVSSAPIEHALSQIGH